MASIQHPNATALPPRSSSSSCTALQSTSSKASSVVLPAAVLDSFSALLTRCCHLLMMSPPASIPPQTWLPFDIRTIIRRQSAQQQEHKRLPTHTTATVIKQAQLYLQEHHRRTTQEQKQAEHDAAAALSSVTESTSVAEHKDNLVPQAPRESAAQSLAYMWCRSIQQQATQLISESNFRPAEQALLHWKIIISVPGPEESVRGGGFIDFTFQHTAAQHPDHIEPTPEAPAHPVASSSPVSFSFTPIGYLDSCYKVKYGTPRQAALAPSSRAKLTLSKHVSPHALDGLSAYSHVWLIFVFHDNGEHVVKPKVKPPRLHGEKAGVFASRSPHRYNPIGLSLVHIDRVDQQKATIHFSAVDLIQGTPILDIKPYHPADTPDINTVTLPDWMTDKPDHALSVDITDKATQQLSALLHKLSFFLNLDEALSAIKESVAFDPRPTYLQDKRDSNAVYGFRLDALNVVYGVDDSQQKATVVGVEFVDVDDEELQRFVPDSIDIATSAALSSIDEKRRTKMWLQRAGGKDRHAINSSLQGAERMDEEKS